MTGSWLWYPITGALALLWDVVSGEPLSVGMALVCMVLVGPVLRRI